MTEYEDERRAAEDATERVEDAGPVAGTEPAGTEPVATEPLASEPAASEHEASEPVASEPVASEPAAGRTADTRTAPYPTASYPVEDLPPAGYGVGPGGGRPEPVATEERTLRRGPDLFMLFSGVLTLLVAAYVLSDGRIWLRDVDPRWLIAGGALVVGLLLLGASLRPGSGRRR